MKIKKITTAIALLLLVSSFAHAQGGARFTISWDRITDPTVVMVLIYRSLPDDNSEFELIDSVSVSTTSYVDTGLEYNRRYYYRLRARDYTNSLSPFSAEVSGIALDADCDPSLRNLCRIVSTTRVDSVTFRFEWSTESPTTGKLRYWKAGDTDFEETTESTTTSYTHTETLSGLEFDKIYNVCAVGHDTNGNLVVSEPSVVSTQSDTSSTDDGGTDEDPDHEGKLVSGTPKIYPVPFNPDEGELYFSNIPESGIVTIYDMRGRRVYRAKWSGQTTITWDGRNDLSTIVSSGRYYIVIKGPDGDILDKRAIVVVR